MEALTKISWSDSIQTRISVVLILLTTIIVSGFAFYNVLQTRQQMQSDLDELATNIAERLSGQLAEPLWSIDEIQIYADIDAEMLQKEIAAIVIRDTEDRSPLFFRQRDSKETLSVDSRETNIPYIIKSKIIRNSDGEELAVLDIFVTPEYMERELLSSVVSIIVAMMILNIALFLAIYITMRHVLIQPIRALTEAANRISRGELEATIDTTSHNEIGHLARAIDRLQVSTKMAMRRLKKI
ncbi:HAMP domain-containing protein [Motiliproteus sp. MSK22-1]|uniref:HAMP domain-containing protein n=1 Tax=Motiliproteus sp. MSK22-1 TaxID=1897630 RepID=UPI00097549E0|nr:HAMP domain-containing protein [Motiliproteus sp. MSK22-1]OMH33283.1 hypothetical protein BGP75_13645 [Motiliproteus sp. MSK22-1]